MQNLINEDKSPVKVGKGSNLNKQDNSSEVEDKSKK